MKADEVVKKLALHVYAAQVLIGEVEDAEIDSSLAAALRLRGEALCATSVDSAPDVQHWSVERRPDL